jgi:hypothetical protein
MDLDISPIYLDNYLFRYVSNETAMTEPGFQTLLQFFKALGNDSRLKLVGLLAQGERSVQELATLLGLREPTVSHHLALLREVGIVRLRADGNTRWYALQTEVLSGISRSLLSRDAVAALAQDVPADAWEMRIIENFLDRDQRLKDIPASRKKRWVVLKWLAGRFEPGRRYREAEINEAIQRHHWDSATLRRELVGYRMMARKAGVYWRLPESDWLPA